MHATVAHWLTEIRGNANPLKADDPRFAILVTLPYAGTIRTLGQIGNGVWATAPTYAATCLQVMNQISRGPGGPGAAGGNVNIQIEDFRNRLMTNPSGGPNTTATVRDSIVVHYNGPPPNPDAVTQYINDAVYHCNKDWSSDSSGAYGDGIMYHFGIGGDGTVYQLRDESAVLWHCAASENYTGLAINVNMGDGQHATPQQIASLTALVDAKRQQYGIATARVVGHQEVSPTACPGTLMGDFVYPYRAGTIGGGQVAIGFKDDVTGHLVANAMYDHYTATGGLAVHGRPLTEEFQGPWPDDPNGAPPRTQQIFERSVFGFFPEYKDPFRVESLLLSTKYARSLDLHGPGID